MYLLCGRGLTVNNDLLKISRELDLIANHYRQVVVVSRRSGEHSFLLQRVIEDLETARDMCADVGHNEKI
jgi:hypothetical protein